jgi:hypothetical protein
MSSISIRKIAIAGLFALSIASQVSFAGVGDRAPEPVFFSTALVSITPYEGQVTTSGELVPTGREREAAESKVRALLPRDCSLDGRVGQLARQNMLFDVGDVGARNINTVIEFDAPTRTLKVTGNAVCRVTFYVRQAGY